MFSIFTFGKIVVKIGSVPGKSVFLGGAVICTKNNVAHA